jgi:hypothetical protein
VGTSVVRMTVNDVHDRVLARRCVADYGQATGMGNQIGGGETL